MEGKLNMRFISKQNLGAVKSAGRTMVAGLVAALLAANSAAQSQKSVPDVATLSMEDLMKLEVTSVSKRTQKVADAAAAVFVITQEMIRRSGATVSVVTRSWSSVICVIRDVANAWSSTSSVASMGSGRGLTTASAPRSAIHRHDSA